MRRTRLGCLSGTGLIAALITLLAIAGYGFASGSVMFSPGALNAVQGQMIGGVTSHAEIEDCAACHAAPWEADSMDDRCVVCHTDVPPQLSDINTEHGRMMKIDPSAQCRDCHPEHHGFDAPLTVLEGWKYPHQLSGFFLDAHQFKAENGPFKCTDCHGSDVTTFDINTCSACHGQIDVAFTVAHIASFGPVCLDCHDGIDSLGKNFTHVNFSFKLTGKHAAVPCEKCHANAHIKADFKTAAQDCASCHVNDDPHGGALGKDCAACHSPEGWKPAQFDHNQAAFKLTGAHEKVACVNCHLDKVYKGTPMDCFACHKQDDHHQGQLGTDCASCHRPTKWMDVTFDHDKSAFPLSGKHESVLCASCHKNDIYKGTPKDCASCHVDVHFGQMGKDCARCHNTGDWKKVIFDHNKTAFPLNGLHTSVACKSCHANGVFKGTPKNCFACHAAKDIHKGQFGTDCGVCHNTSGWKNVTFNHNKTAFPLSGTHTTVACTACHVTNVFKGTPKDCFSCHAAKDAHKGQFGKDCGSCHKPTRWLDVIFDHGKAAFPLNGMHTSVACKSCHVDGVFKGTPKDCFSCHAAKDAHNGQFGTNCGTCHNTSGWKPASFDHNLAAFKLTGMHTTVPCQSCHINNVYKGTPMDCFSCHAAKDAHNGQFSRNCGTCHNTSGWKPASFDHNLAAFKLTGMHTTVPCQSCHSNNVYKGTPMDCFSCHAPKDAHDGQFGTNCGTCHNTSGWKPASFDHNLAAFKLTGMHATVACTACHINGVFKGTPMDCYSCHAANDAHNGQFGTNCAQCHNPGGWKNVTFDHNSTAFPLTGIHSTLNCSSCHVAGQYTGTPTACAACHMEPAFHAGVFGTDCQQCHTTSAWSPAQFIGSHPTYNGTDLLRHHGATCKTCHTTVVTQFTCLACHDSNTP